MLVSVRLNLFVLQRLDRPAGARTWSRVVASVAALLAGEIGSAGLGVGVLFVLVFALPPTGLRMPHALVLGTAAVVAGAFSAGVLGLVHRFGTAETGRTRPDARASFRRRDRRLRARRTHQPADAWLFVAAAARITNLWLCLGIEKASLLAAFTPHAILTWRAMRPILAARAHTQGTATAFRVRLVTGTLGLLVLAALLSLLVHRGL